MIRYTSDVYLFFGLSNSCKSRSLVSFYPFLIYPKSPCCLAGEGDKLRKATTRSKQVAEKFGVSQNCDTLGWVFKIYVSPSGRTAQKEVDEQDAVVVINFKTRLRYLANTPKADWKKPHARKLKGVKDLYEIRFEANNVQHRPLGFFGLGAKEFTILIWATHKQDIYDPSEAIETAEKRRALIEKGEASCLLLKINGKHFP